MNVSSALRSCAVAAIASSLLATSAFAEGAKSVAYIPGFFGNAFYNLLGAGIEAEAKARGWEYSTQGSNQAFNATVQTPIVNAVCGKHPDVLIIAPTDPVAMRGPIQKCMDAGIAVVIVDTTLTDLTGVVSAISSDNLTGGKLAGDYIGKAIGGKGIVSVQSGGANIVTQAARAKGAMDALAADFPDVKQLEIQYYQGDAPAQTGTESTIIGSPGLSAIFNTTSVCQGPSRAIDKAADPKPLLVCFDSSDAVTALLKAGKVGALVVQQAELEGRTAVQFADLYLQGKKDQIQASIVLPPVLITAEHANDEDMQKYYYH